MLKSKGIPVYSFHVASYAEQNFKQISAMTGGTNQFLDVNSSDGQKLLLNYFIERILYKIGDVSGGG